MAKIYDNIVLNEYEMDLVQSAMDMYRDVIKMRLDFPDPLGNDEDELNLSRIDRVIDYLKEVVKNA